MKIGKLKYVTALLILSYIVGSGRTFAQDHIMEEIPLQEVSTSAPAILSASVNNNTIKLGKITHELYNGTGYNRSVHYYDRKGRIVQQIRIGASPSGKDVISFKQYDCMGRGDSVSYMSYTKASTNGTLQSDPLTAQKEFYRGLYPSSEDYNYAYSSKVYDRSPGDILLKSGGMGKKYSVNGDSRNHSSTYSYQKNASNTIYKLTVSSAGNILCNTAYPAGTLIMTQTTHRVSDSGFASAQEYRDSEGKLIARSVGGSGLTPKLEYYAYDELGRLRYIIPQEAYELIKGINSYFTPESHRDLWTYYEYDNEDNIIKSLKPGKAEEYFVYDKKGNLVMSQDGNLRTKNLWLFFSYNSLGRLSSKDLIKDTGTSAMTRSKIQELFDTDSFPELNTSQFIYYLFLESYFYDRYEKFTPQEFLPVAGIVSSEMLAPINNGRLLYEHLNIITDEYTQANSGSLDRTYYYDKKGRVIQKAEVDSSSGITVRYSYKYDLADNIVTSMEVHTDSYGNQNTKRVDYTIDKYGRILSESTTVNGGVPVNLIYTYNELGELASKTFGNTGVTETYDYNLQGRLKSQDSKRMIIEYTYDTQDSDYDNKPRYDGNVSLVKWTYKTTAPKEEAYLYEYDNWGQLKSGIYYDNKTAAGIYDERLQYDRRGNITKLDRSGSTAGKFVSYDYTYDGYQLTSIAYRDNDKTGTYTYTYDDNGNMTYNGNRDLVYVYNYLNLLSTVILPGLGESARYTWLPDGTKHSIQEVWETYKTRFYRGSFTYTGNSISDIESVAFSGGQFLPEKSGSSYVMTPSFVLTDRLGSSRVVMNSAGATITRNNYYPFGLTHDDNLYKAQVTANRFRFNGKEKQCLVPVWDYKLLDYGARMYDPNIGRWTTQDPAGQFTNPYLFCANNPVCFIDADGQWVMFIPIIIGAVVGGYTGYLIGKAAGASGWDMAKYILGGAGIGAVSSGAAVGIAATGGGAMLAGMGAGFLGGAGFNLLAGGSFEDAMKAGAIGGFVGLLSGGVGAAIGGRLGAIAAGMVGSGTYAALSGASPENILRAAVLGGVTSYGVYELTSYISYKYILSNAENQSYGMNALKMTYREYMAMQADFQRSRFWHKEYGLSPDINGDLNRSTPDKEFTYKVGMKMSANPEERTKYVAHTHWVAKEGKAIYLDGYGNKMPPLEMYRNAATRMHGAMDIFPVHSLVLGVNTTTFRIANTTTNILLNFPRFEYFPWFIF